MRGCRRDGHLFDASQQVVDAQLHLRLIEGFDLLQCSINRHPVSAAVVVGALRIALPDRLVRPDSARVGAPKYRKGAGSDLTLEGVVSVIDQLAQDNLATLRRLASCRASLTTSLGISFPDNAMFCLVIDHSTR